MDESRATDYNEEFNDPPNYNGTNEFRASDHDAVVIGIAVGQLQPSGSIGDLVWYDCAVTDVSDPTCANAVQDSGELGIENATVTITGLDGQDVDPNTGGLQTTLSMLTNVNGNYTFSGLPYGNYKVQVLISDVPDPSDRSLRFTTASSYAILLPDGRAVVSADFGVIADTLPDTGLKTDQVLVMAIVLLLVGSLAVLFARRKEEDYLTEMAA
jgi:LPXTG-motif cell wall-anchored protein